MNNHRWLKMFLMIALPMSLLVCFVSFLGYLQDSRSAQTLVKNQEFAKIKLQKELAYHYFALTLNDLMQLANHVQWHEFFEPAGVRAKDILIKEFENVLGKNELYYKIRVLDARGREVIKVETKGEAPHTARGAMLNQAGRDYFLASMQLGAGEVYISGFDLSSPEGSAEYPLTPIIRFGTPVLDQAGQKKGCVIINFFGAPLLRKMTEAFAAASSRMLIVDARGFWIYALRPEEEWGWLRENGREQTIQTWDPAAWKQIAHASSGQCQTARGLITFTRIYPHRGGHAYQHPGPVPGGELGRAEAPEAYWTLLSFVPAGDLHKRERQRLAKALGITGGVLVFVLLISWFATRAMEQRRLAEIALREHEKKYRYMFESNLVGVLYVDIQGVVVDANEYVLRLTGHTGAALPARTLRLADLTEAREGVAAWLVGRIQAQGRMEAEEMYLLREDGARVPVSCMGALLPEKSQCILLVIDLTERRYLEELRQQFFATLSHELKNPITTIISYFRLLEKSQAFSETEREFIGAVNRSAQRLKRLADSILEMEHLEFSPRPEQVGITECAEVVRQAVEACRLTAAEKGLTVSARVEDGGAFGIRAQPEHIEELVVNLIDNALKYTLQGKVEVTLSRVAGGGGAIELRVEDTGIGMEAENVKKIFEGFYRIPGEWQKKVPGSGLGLRIVKDIVERYGGNIRVESSVGKGSCFIVRFPAAA